MFMLWRSCITIGLFFLLLTACSGLITRERRPVAWVDGVAITEKDLKEALKVTHRTERVKPDQKLDLVDYVNKLIDDRLIVQEAYRMGLDKDPWLRNRLEAYKLRESVVRLFNEEVADKVNLKDEEIRQFYNQQMEQVHIRQITVRTEKEAQNIRDRIASGIDMADLAHEHSIDRFKDRGGDRGFLQRSRLPDPVREIVFALEPGQITPVIKTASGYQIIKIEGKRAAPVKDMEEIKQMVGTALRKKKEAERGLEVLKKYRDQVDWVINEELLSELPISLKAIRDKKWERDGRYIAKIRGEVLTVGDFYQQLRNIPEFRLVTNNPSVLKHRFVDNWIDQKLIDINALNRHYEKAPDFSQMLRYYEEYLLKKLFIQRVIYPQIKLSDELLKDYYYQNRDKYFKPVKYKIRQITVNDESRAQEILKQLRGGADFSWTAKNASQDHFAKKGGDRGWTSKQALSPIFSKVISALKVGEVSDVFMENGQYLMVKLEARSEPDYEDFGHVKEAVKRDYFEETYASLKADYVKQLRQDAEITVNQPFIRELTERFFPKVKNSNRSR